MPAKNFLPAKIRDFAFALELISTILVASPKWSSTT